MEGISLEFLAGDRKTAHPAHDGKISGGINSVGYLTGCSQVLGGRVRVSRLVLIPEAGIRETPCLYQITRRR